jgi:hypothetical protein
MKTYTPEILALVGSPALMLAIDLTLIFPDETNW